MNDSKDQATLLAEPWDVLIVLDAARADIAMQLWPEFRQVCASWGITHTWVHSLWGQTVKPMVYYTANPVVTYRWIRDKRPQHVQMVDVWRDCWREWRTGVGSVQPSAVNKYVIDDRNLLIKEWLINGWRGTGRVVVHYLQPHAPYIAKLLPVRTGNITQGPTPSNSMAIANAVKRGIFSWTDLREAYTANLQLVLGHARQLIKVMSAVRKGRYIITSDHGEQLGKGGVFGHSGNADWDLIKRVPWWETTF